MHVTCPRCGRENKAWEWTDLQCPCGNDVTSWNNFKGDPEPRWRFDKPTLLGTVVVTEEHDYKVQPRQRQGSRRRHQGRAPLHR